MSTNSNGRTVPDLTETSSPTSTDFLPISMLQTTGKYSSFKVTQQNLTKLRVVSVTANYTIQANDDAVLADSTAGIMTVTLPTASGIAGVVKIIKKTNAGNNITIACNGAETIDGVTTKTLSTQYDSIKVASNGTNWFVCP